MAGRGVVVVGLVFLWVAGGRGEQETAARIASSAKSGFAFGMLLCILSGIFNAMLNFSFVCGKELTDSSVSGARAAMSANPVWALALSAGFLTNSAYCGYLLNKNRTWPVFCQGRTLAYSGGVILMGLL